MLIFAPFKSHRGVRMSPYKAAIFIATDIREKAKAAPRGVWDNHPKVLPDVSLNSA